MVQYPSGIQNNTTDLPNNKSTSSTLSPTEWNSLVTAVVALENKVLDTASAPTAAGQVFTSIDTDTATWQNLPQTGYYPGGTDVAVADGGTGASTAAGARSNLGAAASGANADITSLSGLTTALSRAQGGTGRTDGNRVPRITNVTYAATLTPDLTQYDIYKETLTGNVTVAAPTGTPYDGQSIRFEFRQDTTGGRAVTYNAAYVFPGGTTPTLTTTASQCGVISFVYDAITSKWRCYATDYLTFLSGN